MAALPTMVDGWQLSPANVAQLVRACNERLAAAQAAAGSTSLPSPIPATTGSMDTLQGNGTDKPLFLQMQEIVEAICVYYCQDGEGLTDLWPSAEEFKAEVLFGLDWRRAWAWADPSDVPTGAESDTGKIQDGDILGWWIVEDLCAAVAALTRTRVDWAPGATPDGNGRVGCLEALDSDAAGGYGIDGQDVGQEALAQSEADAEHDTMFGVFLPVTAPSDATHLRYKEASNSVVYQAEVVSHTARWLMGATVTGAGLGGEVDFWQRVDQASFGVFYDFWGATNGTWATFAEGVEFADDDEDPPQAWTAETVGNARTGHGTEYWTGSASETVIGSSRTVAAVVRWAFTDQ